MKKKEHSLFNGVLFFFAAGLILLVFGIFVTLLFSSLPSLKTFGFGFLIRKTWDPVAREFGAVPFLIGTLATSFLALLVSIPFSLGVSIFLGIYWTRGFLSSLFAVLVELLAAIPSVIYGFWGIFVFVPLVRAMELKTGIVPYGVGIFTASLILAVMIIPYSASLAIELFSLVPADIKEAAYSLGATRYEVARKIILPTAYSGILAGILLSLGRALGETMAVTMVIGNSNLWPKNIFSPSNTMASVIANEFTEATGKLYLSSLIEIGFLLFIVATLANVFGRFVVKKATVEFR